MISILLILLAAICSASMDVLRFRYNISIFRLWKNQNWVNPELSWPNKWKPDSKLGDFIMSTILVWVTDFWHFCKFLMLTFMIGSVIFYHPAIVNLWADVIIFYGTFTITFEIFYSKILIRKKKNEMV